VSTFLSTLEYGILFRKLKYKDLSRKDIQLKLFDNNALRYYVINVLNKGAPKMRRTKDAAHQRCGAPKMRRTKDARRIKDPKSAKMPWSRRECAKEGGKQ
jgi:hypothetical protein